MINARTLRRQLIWTELDSNASTPAEHGAADPPGQELPRGRALHRRAAQPARRRRRAAPAERRVPRATATAIKTDSQRVRAAPAAHGAHLQAAQAGRRQARRALPRLGLHGGERARSLSGRLRGIRDDAFRGLGDTNLGDLQVSGVAAQVHDRQGHRLHAGPERRDPAPRGGHGRGALLPRPARLPGGVALPPRAERPAGAHPRQHHRRELHLQHPALGHARPRRGGCRSTATACSAAPARSTASASCQIASEHRVVLCASRLDRHVRRRRAQHDLDPRRTCRAFPELADRLQQGFLNFLFLGRAMIHPKGFASSLAFWDAGGPADRHAQALLLGRQPGRHRGRGADRGRARLHALGADRAGDELQPAAHALDRLRPVRRGALPGLPGRADPPAAAVADPDALGSRRAGRLRVAHDRPTRTRTRPRTPCCCTWRSATTRWRTSRTEVEARTIGARIRLPAVDPGRHTDVHPYYGIEPITRYPYRGSALVVWDIGPLRGELGTPPPPITNTAAARWAAIRTGSPAARRARSSSSRSSSTASSSTCAAAPRATPPGWTGP